MSPWPWVLMIALWLLVVLVYGFLAWWTTSYAFRRAHDAYRTLTCATCSAQVLPRYMVDHQGWHERAVQTFEPFISLRALNLQPLSPFDC